LDKAAPGLSYSKMGSDHILKITLFILHMFAKCFITLCFLKSIWTQQAYRSCIQLILGIVSHLHNTNLCPVVDLWLSHCVKFVHCMNVAFSLDSDLAIWLQVTRIGPETNKGNMTAEHAFCFLCDGFKHAFDELGHLDNGKHIVF